MHFYVNFGNEYTVYFYGPPIVNICSVAVLGRLQLRDTAGWDLEDRELCTMNNLNLKMVLQIIFSLTKTDTPRAKYHMQCGINIQTTPCWR